MELERVQAGDRAVGGAIRRIREQLESAIEGSTKRHLFLPDRLLHLRHPGLHLGEDVAEAFDDRGDDGVEERAFDAEGLTAMSDGAAEDPTKDVAPAVGARCRTVGKGRDEASRVIRDHAIGHVDRIFEIAAVGPGAAHVRDALEDPREEIGVVVASTILEDGDDALEAHAGVDVTGRKLLERSPRLTVELDEHEVPDLEHVGVVLVHQRRGVSSADAIDVEFGARTAGAGLAHLPEVVLGVPGNHVVGGEVAEPEVA